MFFFPLCIMTSLVIMMKQQMHVLMMLLSLEMMILTFIFWISFMTKMNLNNTLLFSIILLTLGAVEAVLGLSCLVKMTRMFGNDLLKAKNMYLC